jgi:4-hydroxymandelate oxidase
MTPQILDPEDAIISSVSTIRKHRKNARESLKASPDLGNRIRGSRAGVTWGDGGCIIGGRRNPLSQETNEQAPDLEQYAAVAQKKLPKMVWDYYAGGAGAEQTVAENCAAFAQIALRPRVLVDVSECKTATTVLGIPVATPILVAPTAFHMMAHPDGECATARGAGAAGTVMIASTLSNRTLEEIAAAATGPLWFQIYVYRDRTITERLVRRAEAAGFRALVLTVDAPCPGRRPRDIRNGFRLPSDLRMANLDEEGANINRMAEAPGGGSGLDRHFAANLEHGLTWKDIAWLRGLSSLPLILKGILTAEDTRLAVEHGVDGVVVSNHGGRQLDGTLPTILALPEVVAAANKRLEILVDGGVRVGTDVFKALALGARAVLIGRPVLWGLTVAGAPGVAHVLDLLTKDLVLTQRLMGCPDVQAIGRSYVQ